MRPEGAKAVRPRNAATLFIIRRDGPKPRVLMGKRHGGHNFMPNLWVFPGGRIDRADFRAPAATDLRPEVAGKFEAYMPLNKGRALGKAAIRETIVNPNAQVTKGYAKGIMPANYGQVLSAKEIDELVNYIYDDVQGKG